VEVTADDSSRSAADPGRDGGGRVGRSPWCRLGALTRCRPGRLRHRPAGAAVGTDDAVQVGEATAALERLARWLHATYVAAQPRPAPGRSPRPAGHRRPAGRAIRGSGRHGTPFAPGALWTRASAPLGGRLRSPAGGPIAGGSGSGAPVSGSGGPERNQVTDRWEPSVARWPTVSSRSVLPTPSGPTSPTMGSPSRGLAKGTSRSGTSALARSPARRATEADRRRCDDHTGVSGRGHGVDPHPGGG
jgi:hypothetical protein